MSQKRLGETLAFCCKIVQFLHKLVCISSICITMCMNTQSLFRLSAYFHYGIVSSPSGSVEFNPHADGILKYTVTGWPPDPTIFCPFLELQQLSCVLIACCIFIHLLLCATVWADFSTFLTTVNQLNGFIPLFLGQLLN